MIAIPTPAHTAIRKEKAPKDHHRDMPPDAASGIKVSPVDAIKVPQMQERVVGCEYLHKRSVPYSTSLNPLTYLSMAWTGTSPRDAIDSEQALLSTYVKTPFELGRVPINMSSIGLGRQYINMVSFNPDVKPPEAADDPPPIVWLHGAGAGLGFAYRNYDRLCNLGGKRRRVFGVDWLGQAGSSRPSYPYGGLRMPSWALTEAQQVEADASLGARPLLFANE